MKKIRMYSFVRGDNRRIDRPTEWGSFNNILTTNYDDWFRWGDVNYTYINDRNNISMLFLYNENEWILYCEDYTVKDTNFIKF